MWQRSVFLADKFVKLMLLSSFVVRLFLFGNVISLSLAHTLIQQLIYAIQKLMVSLFTCGEMFSLVSFLPLIKISLQTRNLSDV